MLDHVVVRVAELDPVIVVARRNAADPVAVRGLEMNAVEVARRAREEKDKARVLKEDAVSTVSRGFVVPCPGLVALIVARASEEMHAVAPVLSRDVSADLEAAAADEKDPISAVVDGSIPTGTGPRREDAISAVAKRVISSQTAARRAHDAAATVVSRTVAQELTEARRKRDAVPGIRRRLVPPQRVSPPPEPNADAAVLPTPRCPSGCPAAGQPDPIQIVAEGQVPLEVRAPGIGHGDPVVAPEVVILLIRFRRAPSTETPTPKFSIAPFLTVTSS